MTKFATERRYPGFIWLGSRGQKWVACDRVPENLLEPHDTALADLDANPHDMKAAVAWMDACDAIYERVGPILDGAALQASFHAHLRMQGEERALDAFLSPRLVLRP